MSPYVVVAAAIVHEGLVLAAQRAYPGPLAGRWELPGGKVEPGESETAALARECREELGVDIGVGERAAPDAATIDGNGVLRTYWATVRRGTPEPLEHQALRWLGVAELDEVDWLAADLPVVDALRQRLISGT